MIGWNTLRGIGGPNNRELSTIESLFSSQTTGVAGRASSSLLQWSVCWLPSSEISRPNSVAGWVWRIPSLQSRSSPSEHQCPVSCVMALQSSIDLVKINQKQGLLWSDMLHCWNISRLSRNHQSKRHSVIIIVADTFASKVSAVQDKYADNSIGNVTGSNAVNVFLGIGIAWSMAAIYHMMNGNVYVALFFVPRKTSYMSI